MRWPWLSLLVLLAAAGLGAAAGILRPAHPAQALLQAHLAQPPGSEGLYPRLAPTLHARAWLLSAPGQSQGIALFSQLPEAVFPAERVIQEHELHPTLALIWGRTWDARLQAWIAADPGLQPVPLARVRAGLEAACPTPADAHLVIDLLLGEPAPGVPDLAAHFRAGKLPHRLLIQPFHGTRGLLLRDVGKDPYQVIERRYAGCLLRFDGPGWPQGWRMARLSVVGY